MKLYSGIDSFPFLAIPLFILAGGLMEHGGISKRLVRLAQNLFGHIRGGLGFVVVVSEIFFSGISGSSIADASAIGSLLLPSMVKTFLFPSYLAWIPKIRRHHPSAVIEMDCDGCIAELISLWIETGFNCEVLSRGSRSRQ